MGMLAGAIVLALAGTIGGVVAVVKARGYVAAPPVAPAARVDAAGPVLGSIGTNAPLPTTAGITAALAPLIKDPRLGSHLSIAVRDLVSGQLVYGHNEASPTVPASSMKLATATALLALRGPDYRITTKVVAGANPGEVVLVGAGDPTLGAGPDPTYPESGRLDVLADEVNRALGGVKPTKVIIDTSLFPGPSIGPGWLASDYNGGRYIDRIYALTTDGGRVNRAKIGNSARFADSATAAGQAFARYLGLPASAVAAGRAPQTTTAGGGAAAPGSTVPGAVLGSVQSAPIVRILDTMLSNSDNVLAEFMARQVAIASGLPASFAGASEAVTRELGKLGLPTAGIHIVDGSGLSTLNRLTPALLSELLSFAAQPTHPPLHALFSGMPIAGYSGTLSGRFRNKATISADGVLRAKTGTLTGVHALAGTVIDSSGRILAFALMVDKAAWNADAPAALDLIGAALYRCGCTG